MRNFGSIRTHINRKLSDAYINESAEGKDMFKKYIKLLKEDTNTLILRNYLKMLGCRNLES